LKVKVGNFALSNQKFKKKWLQKRNVSLIKEGKINAGIQMLKQVESVVAQHSR
jgi:hypothetical protein